MSDFIKIGHLERGWLKVELHAASRIYFEISEGKRFEETLQKICDIAPKMIRLDGDMMEMFDDAGRTKPRTLDVNAVRAFARNNTFRNVDCALPGFEEM